MLRYTSIYNSYVCVKETINMQEKFMRGSEPLGGAYGVPFLLIRALHLSIPELI